MKLVTYTHGAIARPGLLVSAQNAPNTDDASGAVVLDLLRSLAWIDGKISGGGGPKSERPLVEKFGDSVLGFIEHARDARPLAVEAIAAHGRGELPAKTDAGAIAMPASEVTLLAPIPRPPSMRDGYAFRQHVETARRNRGLEMIPEFDQFPVFYFTNHQAVIGPGPLAVRPKHLERLDFELEAAIVVGREARDLTAANADEVIFGMTIMNDFSARALQMQEMLLSLGPAKGKDFATGLGPYLVRHGLLPRAQRLQDHEGPVAEAGRHRRSRDRPSGPPREHHRRILRLDHAGVGDSSSRNERARRRGQHVIQLASSKPATQPR
jgi:2-keto-4-pentenoate hydratase/2-oxohepta-3-ene-1,7-dioic acid hydratase in catechol pathway